MNSGWKYKIGYNHLYNITHKFSIHRSLYDWLITYLQISATVRSGNICGAQDALVIWKLDRLGRTVKGLVDFVGELAERKVQFRSLTDGIDTNTPTGRFFFHVMASLAQMERELIAERTKAGLDAARQRGRLVGRKRSMTPSKIESAKQLLSTGMPPREVAQNLGVSVPTLYRWVPASRR